MSANSAPHSETTIALIFGASRWPDCPKFQDAPSLERSADAFIHYLRSEQGLRLPLRNIKSLFNSYDDPAEQLDQARAFVMRQREQSDERGQPIRDLIIYYAGHGDFEGEHRDFYLTIRRAHRDHPLLTNITARSFGNWMRQTARDLRSYLIIDCCFAAALQHGFLSSPLGLAELRLNEALPSPAIFETDDDLPTAGVALLAAAGPNDPASAPPDELYTRFTATLLEVLRDGNERLPPVLSLSDLHRLVDWRITQNFTDQARPELRSLQQTRGRVELVRLFRNPAAERAEEKRRAEEATTFAEERRQAEETARLVEEKRKADEAARLAEERRQADKAARREEEQRQAEETARLAEERRQADKAARREEEQRKAEEAARLAEEKRKAAEAARRAEKERKADEVARPEERYRVTPQRRPSKKRQLAYFSIFSLVAVTIILALLEISSHEPAKVIPSAGNKQPDEAAQQMAQQKNAEAAQKLARQRADEEVAQALAKQLAKQQADVEAAQKQAQQRAAEDAVQKQAQQQAAQDAVQKLAQQQAAQDSAQKQAQQQASDEAAKAQQVAEQISEAQRRLFAMGLLAGGIDGKLGARTREAIRAFQLAEGIPDNGQLSDMLLSQLRATPPRPDSRARALASLASEAVQSGRTADAVRLYSAILKVDPLNGNVLITLGDLYKTSGNSDEARRYWSQAANSSGPEGAEGKSRLANLPEQSGSRSGNFSPPVSATSGPEIGPPVSVTPGPENTAEKKAALTSPELPRPVGELSLSGKCLAPNAYLRSIYRWIMKNDGGWCWSRLFSTSYQITRVPTHGQIFVGPINDVMRVAYKPEVGFVGTDSFTIMNNSKNTEAQIFIAVFP
jgi:peptidoglycan hydrolase-like protein with peptidoglycan-binding domain